MRSFLAALFAALTLTVAAAQPPVKSDAPPPADPQFPRGVRPASVKSDAPLIHTLTAEQKAEHAKKFPRGARPATPEKLQSVPKFRPAVNYQTATTTQFAMVPSAIHMWGNDQFGDCVSAQEACSMAAYTTFCGQPVVPSDAEVIAFARKHNWLNGADLPEVMDVMQSEGMAVGGKTYKAGPYKAVDYKNQAAAQAALLIGPLNIAIDANALPSSAGNKMGWYVTGGSPGQYPNTDHCVTLLGFGPAKYLFEQIKTPLPSGLAPETVGFLLDTWNTIGFIDQAWVLSTVVEEYVRTPTTVGFTPPAPTPDPTPVPPVPVPPQPPTPGTGFTGTIVYAYINGQLVSVTTTPAPQPAPPPKETTGEELAAAASLGYDSFAARLDKVKFCLPAILLGFQLYTDIQKHAPPDVILADIVAINLAVQACKAQGSAAPGGSPVMAAAGDCGQQQFGAAGACSSAGSSAGACGPAGAGFSLRHPFGGFFAGRFGGAGSCGQAAYGPESAYMAAGACGQASAGACGQAAVSYGACGQPAATVGSCGQAAAYYSAGSCGASAGVGACGAQQYESQRRTGPIRRWLGR